MNDSVDTALFTDLIEARKLVGDFISLANSIIEEAECLYDDDKHRLLIMKGVDQLKKKLEELEKMRKLLNVMLLEMRLEDANRQADVIARNLSGVIKLTGLLVSPELEEKALHAVGM